MPEWYGLNKGDLTKGLKDLPLPVKTALQAKGQQNLVEFSLSPVGTLDYRTKARINRQRGAYGWHTLAREVQWKLGIRTDTVGREIAEHGFDKKVDLLSAKLSGEGLSTAEFFDCLKDIRAAGVGLEATDKEYSTGVPASDNPAERFGESVLLCLLATRALNPDRYPQMLAGLKKVCETHKLRTEVIEKSSQAEAKRQGGGSPQTDPKLKQLNDIAPYIDQIRTITEVLYAHDQSLSIAEAQADADNVDVDGDGGIEEEEVPVAAEAVSDNNAGRRGTIYEQHYRVDHMDDPQDRARALKDIFWEQMFEAPRPLANKPPEMTEQEKEREFKHVTYLLRASKASKAVIEGMWEAQTANDRKDGSVPDYDIDDEFERTKKLVKKRPPDVTDDDVAETRLAWAYEKAVDVAAAGGPINRHSTPIYPSANAGLAGQIRDFQTALKEREIDPDKTLKLYRTVEKERERWAEMRASREAVENDLFNKDELFNTCLAMAEAKTKMDNAHLSTVRAIAHGYKNLILQNGIDDELIVRVRNETRYAPYDHVGPEYREYMESQDRSFANLMSVMLGIPDDVKGAAKFKALVAKPD